MALKTGKNLVNSRTEYNACYDGMRGVDFTTNHSQVSNNRFAYLVNMYRNYRADGLATETIPGYVKTPFYEGCFKTEPKPTECRSLCTYKVDDRDVFFLQIDNFVYGMASGEQKGNESFAHPNKSKTISRNNKNIRYDFMTPEKITTLDRLKTCCSFILGQSIYFLTDYGIKAFKYSKGSVTYNFESKDCEPYIPTTYINLPPSGWQQDENNAYGAEYEQRNLLTDKFKVTFIADGESEQFYLPESSEGLSLDSIDGIEGCTSELSQDDGRAYILIKINAADGQEPQIVPKGTKITVTLLKTIKSINGASDAEDAKNLILGCTKSCLFDNRVFLTGNPECPNHIFWSGFNAETGMTEPTYFGILDNMYDGITSKITGFMAVSDTFVVLKEDNSEGTMYFHRPQATGEDLQPKVYPSSRGMTSAGCDGACINFIDDPVFISRLGLEGIDHTSAGMERIVGHRSSNVDAQLLKHDLTKARLAEWNGYLLLLVDGYLFMADSRQKFTHHTGSVQYEWYYVDRLGEWVDDLRYVYAKTLPDDLVGKGYKEHPSESDEYEYVKSTDVKKETVDLKEIYYTEKDSEKYLVYPAQQRKDGEFWSATDIVSTGGNIYFVTNHCNLMMFNFDLMDENGELPTSAYSFAGHTIKSGAAFKMDNVGIPHLTKSTIKKSTVVKMKPMRRSGAKVKIRTNRDPYHELNSINSARFDFNDIDFGDFTFLDGEQSLFVIYEKEKKWVEKQYYIYSDEYCRPFALYSLAFRYYVAGRYKEK